ncbi:4-hydroxyphenylacetate degradation bifunctional isomerase/decarboxylase,HpaG2 subunit [Sulfobacillus acidophilus TPY]|uniref:4-hydroxyphenylacetate degradation bifunctional isomerase/decarboxylase,HpaG2 subunit n=1 Tax=Sulfobacillus acidophilus (strain ATCC 700253 / DSM 10332 / NAL) TaxID=679936 RepID=G8TSH2_SULAD|nr:4-hydroxyphenylacetate degradation bifunctional isomerase/decarboxylase,HpaG2 subunit [Sulfobacillus acidophilus TPY]AEW06664.1 4-hydroxyphenylacetate degradation bifunctional isomerase/decarboxylase,HpaG2 subunit [Sulfobacillus acidophilus DSM 10332]
MRSGRIWVDGRIEWVNDDHGQVVSADGRRWDPNQVAWMSPIDPRNIIGLALNYGGHAAELGLEQPSEPALFFKPTSAVIGAGHPVRYPVGATHCHYETEVAVVIGRPCRGVAPEHALEYVLGYTIANDFTCRDFIRNTFRPPVRAKGFDTFLPLGPWLVSPDEVGDPDQLTIITRVNGEVRQTGNTRHLIYAIPEIIAHLSSFMTLAPGDVILTGTPDGISPVVPGDVMACEIENLGVLMNPVVADHATFGEEQA